MARPLRIEYRGALYHITSRGDRQEPIFEDDQDRRAFLNLLKLARYIVLNAVRAGMVKHPRRSEWSSYNATLGKSPAPAWLSSDEMDAIRAAYQRTNRWPGNFGVHFTTVGRIARESMRSVGEDSGSR